MDDEILTYQLAEQERNAELPTDPVNRCFACKLQHQPVGQTYDLIAACAPAPLHAIVVRAVRFGDGHLAVFDGDGIGTAFCFHDDGGVLGQGQGVQKGSIRIDLHSGRVFVII